VISQLLVIEMHKIPVIILLILFSSCLFAESVTISNVSNVTTNVTGCVVTHNYDLSCVIHDFVVKVLELRGGI
jgi:hypothetical protein